MTANGTKKSVDWLNLAKFTIFFATCLASVFIWYYSQQANISNDIASTYVSKTELKLVTQKIDVLENSFKEFKNDFSSQLNSLEDTNNEIVGLITDIRLTLARIVN